MYEKLTLRVLQRPFARKIYATVEIYLFCSMRRLEALLTPSLDGMLVHHRITPIIFLEFPNINGSVMYVTIERDSVQ